MQGKFANLRGNQARKRMRSGDRPGLQNRRAAGFPVAGGFDPHSLPPFLAADGSDAMAKRIERVLTADPGMGIVRHVDAGYEEATYFAARHGAKTSMPS